MDSVEPYFNKNVAEDWSALRGRLMGLLQDESELEEIVNLVGIDALSAADRLKLEAARSIREDYLHQNAFDDVDTYTSPKKQHMMMQLILAYYDEASKALEQGAKVTELIALSCREDIGRFKYTAEQDISAEYDKLISKLQQECAAAVAGKEAF